MGGTDNTMDILNLQFTGGEDEEQLIIFILCNEEFGLNVLRVQEIIRYITPTKIPHAPEFMEGVIDFRGEVIPVINLRMQFGLPVKTNNLFNVIIVIEHNGKTMGLVVDRVSDIMNIPADKIQQAPEFSAHKKTEYLKAMGKLGERLILLLDLDKIIEFNEHEISEELLLDKNKENNGK